ncbi:MAG: hypothetical protein LBG87_03235 [Spirochaetaceae bacterium]|jgi:hypothetical protein|nr:hypothetical protein [Spirochaetaceae bacterium]
MPPILSKIQTIMSNLFGDAAEVLKKQQKLLKLCLGMLVILLAVIFALPRIVQAIIDRSPRVSSETPRKLDHTPITIPVEELFLPDEPNFLPEVLLEQEPRAQWTAEDVRPFWRDPSEEAPEKWRERIETVIDELLKGVP